MDDNIPSINVDPNSPLDGPPSFEHRNVASHITTACTTRIRPSLPADIISLIAAVIPSLYSSWGYRPGLNPTFINYAKTALAFSQISRLFRQVALHTQTLWSRIYVIYELDGESVIFPWELFLARSRMAPLFVTWVIIKDADEEFDYGIADFALLFNSQQRWKELYLNDDVSFYKIFSSFIGSDDMPSLPALEVLSVPEPQANKEDIPFLTPNLKHLNTDDPLIFEILAPTLVSCTLDFSFNYDRQDVLDNFKEFLGMCPLLENLWIKPDAKLSDGFDHKYIDLPSVKNLRVDSFYMSLRSLGILLQSMHMANLENLQVLFIFAAEDVSFAEFFRRLGFASHVRSLTLVAAFVRSNCTSVPFRLIDERFCSVSSLTVSGWIYTDQIRGCHLPTLRRLVVEWSPLGEGRPMLEDVRTTVEDVLEFLQNRSHSDGQEEYEPFHLILCGYGSAARDEEVRAIVDRAGGTLVFEARLNANLFYSFVPYISRRTANTHGL